MYIMKLYIFFPFSLISIINSYHLFWFNLLPLYFLMCLLQLLSAIQTKHYFYKRIFPCSVLGISEIRLVCLKAAGLTTAFICALDSTFATQYLFLRAPSHTNLSLLVILQIDYCIFFIQCVVVLFSESISIRLILIVFFGTNKPIKALDYESAVKFFYLW